MSLSALIRKRSAPALATATPATFATHGQGTGATVARVATVAVANPTESQVDSPIVGAGDAAILEPLDQETFEERAAIAEFDGGLSRDAAEHLATATMANDQITCRQCANRRPHDGMCKVAEPKVGAVVIASRGYIPDATRLWRCEGYQPKHTDPDQRTGDERWPWLRPMAIGSEVAS